jgi:hypothetical protein
MELYKIGLYRYIVAATFLYLYMFGDYLLVVEHKSDMLLVYRFVVILYDHPAVVAERRFVEGFVMPPWLPFFGNKDIFIILVAV